jgi:transposase
MKYADLIKESESDLLLLERREKNAMRRDRIRFIRTLKSGEFRSQTRAGGAIGLGERQSQRLWSIYIKGGIKELLSTYSERWWGKLSSVQISQLRTFLLSDQAQTLADIQAYLSGNLGVKYSISGVSELCKRLKIKAKTGRPVNVRQKPGDVDDFKKNL